MWYEVRGKKDGEDHSNLDGGGRVIQREREVQ